MRRAPVAEPAGRVRIHGVERSRFARAAPDLPLWNLLRAGLRGKLRSEAVQSPAGSLRHGEKRYA